MSPDEIKSDIISFADDEEDFVFDPDGSIIFTRQSQEISIKIEFDKDTGGCYVIYENIKIPYRKFISEKLANLTVFANKLIEKREVIEPFINSKATIFTNYNSTDGHVLELLDTECKSELPFGTKMTFVTADAGHGKTALLKEFQRITAQKYIKGESTFVFWHIDLQGRDLVRLNEAIVYDLGELRLTGIGLYYSSILTLIKQGLIILAIDGFDELAAEVGGNSALGALASLVSSLGGKGTIVAASRRAFFNTQDYVKRTSFLHSDSQTVSEIHDFRMHNWIREENEEYLSYHFNEPHKIQDEIISELHDQNHPILTRPYLFTKIVNISVESKKTPSEVLKGIENKGEGINIVVEAFIKREVNKWKDRDKETGRPYLTFEQHLKLLTSIAHEMWENQSDLISLENLQFILTILFDEWDIEDRMQPLIMRMAESHAFLIKDQISERNRRFEHEEFKRYFIAKEIKDLLYKAMDKGNLQPLRKLLYLSQLPDSVALYFTLDLNGTNIENIITILMGVLKDEWKPTYLQINVGTLLPYLLNNYSPNNIIQIDEKVTITSLIFENKAIKKIKFIESSFVNISFRNTNFENIQFHECTFNEIRIYHQSANKFDNILFDICKIDCIVFISDNGEKYSEYNPEIIKRELINIGFTFKDTKQEEIDNLPEENPLRKVVKRFLNKFNTSTYQFEKNIENEPFYSKDKDIILGEVIPLLEKHDIIEQKETKKSKQASTVAWRLVNPDLHAILNGETDENSKYYKFWGEI